MRALLMTYGWRGNVQPLVGLAVPLQALGAEPRFCAPPDEELAELLAGVGVPLVPIARPVRPPVSKAMRMAAGRRPPRADALVAARFDTVAAAAEECEVRVATGVMPTGGWR